jgi:hypothetical protein
MACKVADDDSRIADRVNREWRGAATRYGGCQPFGGLPNGERKGMLELNAAEVGHRITLPRCRRMPRQPCLACEGHGPTRTDTSFPLVPVPPGLFSKGKSCINGRSWFHEGTLDDLPIGNRDAHLACQDVHHLRTALHEERPYCVSPYPATHGWDSDRVRWSS